MDGDRIYLIQYILCYSSTYVDHFVIVNVTTMKLFVSYRRKSWPFTSQLSSNLRKRIDAEVFVDYQLVDDTAVEKWILHKLRDSDVDLLVVYEYTVDSR